MLVQITDDFDLQKIVGSGQCFRAVRMDDGFRFMTGDHVLYIRKEGRDSYRISCSEADWLSVWRPYFDLDTNYAAIRAKAQDSYLKEAAQRGAGIRILRQEPWETLVSFIISQRKSIPAIRACVEALAQRYGHPIPDANQLYTFPTADALAQACEKDLDDCRLGYRTPYVMDAAQRVSRGITDLSEIAGLPDQELLSRLMEIKGVGIKVASCVALFAYGRKDVAPVDTWIQKTIRAHYGGVDPFPAYGDIAGVMQQYMFYRAQGGKTE